MDTEPKNDGYEQLRLDIDSQFLGSVAVRPTLEQVIEYISPKIESGLRRHQNEKLQGSLL